MRLFLRPASRRTARRFRLSCGFALLLACCVASPAPAQVFLTAPQDLWKLQSRPVPPSVSTTRAPQAAPAPAPAGSPSQTKVDKPKSVLAASEAKAQDAQPTTVLRHLTNNVQGYRLAGEVGSSEWPVYLTEAQARRKLQFQLGYLAAVSVAPEASTLTLTINDEIVAAAPVRAVGAVRTIVFDIPPGLMQAGFNAVRISADQRHRVDCSIQATFELWTQIDPTQTGVLLPARDASIESLADLGALLPDEQGALPIRAVLPASPKESDVERMLRAVQLISIVGRFEQPVVDVGPLSAGAYGVNLLVGDAQELRAQLGFDLLGPVDRPRALVLAATPQRRTTLVITGATPAQVSDAMRQFLVATTAKGAPAGLRAAAAFPGYRVEGGRNVKLRDLGASSEQFTGRLFRTAFNISMPTDFYAADYGRATLRLAGAYAPALTSRAQVVLNVNDRTAVSLSLLNADGDVFQDRPLPLPLGFLRPGLNRIEIEAHVPNASDDKCDPLAMIHATNRYLFLDSTQLEIPAIARVARMPDLAVTATGGFPFAGSPTRPKLFTPSLDPKSIGAAATLVAHLAIAANRPIDFEVTSAPPPLGKGPTLAVAPIDALDGDLLQKLNAPAKELRDAWRPTPDGSGAETPETPLERINEIERNRSLLQNNFPMACLPSARSAGQGFAALPFKVDRRPIGAIDPQPDAAATIDEDEGETRELFREWDAKVRSSKRWRTRLTTLVADVSEWTRSKFTDAARRIGSRFDSDGGPLVTPRSSLAIAQNMLGATREDVWTVVTAANPSTLAQSVACLVDPRVSRQIGGRLSVLDLSQAKITAAPATNARFVVTQPLSVGNARLIAAGWLSLHCFAYVAGALAIGLLLALTTRWFVANVGRKGL